MTTTLSTDAIVKLTRQVAALYVQQDPPETFGEWMLNTFYAKLDRYSLVNAHHLANAARTFDGRMYLSGMLHAASLDPAPLLDAVALATISDIELRMVV